MCGEVGAKIKLFGNVGAVRIELGVMVTLDGQAVVLTVVSFWFSAALVVAVKDELVLLLLLDVFLSILLLLLLFVAASDEIEILFVAIDGCGACMVGMVGCCKNKSVCG